MEEEENFA